MSDVEPEQALTVDVRREAGGVVVAVVGELDLHESRRLSSAVSELVSEPVERIELDATGLAFIDSAGIRAILLARSAITERGISFVISGVSPPIRRVMEIAGAEALLPEA
jgi:anti-sigma B factor antagonist